MRVRTEPIELYDKNSDPVLILNEPITIKQKLPDATVLTITVLATPAIATQLSDYLLPTQSRPNEHQNDRTNEQAA